jgi:hypothetical protein
VCGGGCSGVVTQLETFMDKEAQDVIDQLNFGCPFKAEGIAEYDVPAAERVMLAAAAFIGRLASKLEDTLEREANLCSYTGGVEQARLKAEEDQRVWRAEWETVTETARALALKLEAVIDVAETERKRLSARYADNIANRCSEMGGNMDWARLEGAVFVVHALRGKRLPPHLTQTPSHCAPDAVKTYESLMPDFEKLIKQTKVCADAMGIDVRPYPNNNIHHYWRIGETRTPYDPAHNGSQCMALIKRFTLRVDAFSGYCGMPYLNNVNTGCLYETYDNESVNYAVLGCVAARQADVVKRAAEEQTA